MLLSIVSCYDDEGNYDYHDINEVTFGEINTMYNVLLNIDTLKIDVGDFVEMSQGDLTDTDRFEYLWVTCFPPQFKAGRPCRTKTECYKNNN